MKKFLVGLVVFVCLPSYAGTVAGTGGATEVTQILNNVQLTASYAQGAQRLQQQILMYAAMVKNLENNPLGAVIPDMNILVSNQAKIIAAGTDIGSSMATVDTNFAKNFNNPTAATYGEKFGAWTTTSTSALKTAMLNAGLQRENFADDTTALQALVTKNQASTGDLGALKTLGEINTSQLQESMKLRDLISSQQLATGTYLAAQASKGQAATDNDKAIQDGFLSTKPTSVPALDTSTKTYSKLNYY